MYYKNTLYKCYAILFKSINIKLHFNSSDTITIHFNSSDTITIYFNSSDTITLSPM